MANKKKGKIMIRFVLITALLMLASVTTSEAKSHHRKIGPAPMCVETGDILRPTCGYGNNANFLSGVREIKVTMHRTKHVKEYVKHSIAEPVQTFGWFEPVRNVYTKIGHVAHSIAEKIVEHPTGCPSRAFCGCGASVDIYGHPVKELFLAANWYKFPRAEPAPNTVAVRRHHVFVLKQHVEGTRWIVFDANTTGHTTKIHERSISGYTIVNPHG